MENGAVLDIDNMVLSIRFMGEVKEFKIIENDLKLCGIDNFKGLDGQSYDFVLSYGDIDNANLIMAKYDEVNNEYYDEIDFPLILKRKLTNN